VRGLTHKEMRFIAHGPVRVSSPRGSVVHIGIDDGREWTTFCGAKFGSGNQRVGEVSCQKCLPHVYVLVRRPASATPTTPCSVVWYDGHPWVLDGEPGVPTERSWVGVRRDGSVGTMSMAEMSAHFPAVIYNDPGDHD
jgi:hypothetical protein